jgi:glycosyltransferase involved in cell wall biosynthesis
MKVSAGRVLMLLENNYPQDSRVRNEATLLTSAGYEVAVICLRKKCQKFTEVVDGVRVYRVPRLELFQKTPDSDSSFVAVVFLKLKSFLGYLFEYFYFTSACLAVSSYAFITGDFDVIHAHNPPDTLFLVALPFKLLGKKFVFDHHDLCPELYQSRYAAKPGFFTRLLGVFEWCSLKLADITIATNESYKQIHVKRGRKRPEKVFVVRNGPDESRMTQAVPNPRLRAMGKCVLCYIGSLNPQDGVDYLLRSLHCLLYTMKRRDFHCVIMGTGDSLEDLRALSRELHLEGHVELPGFVSEDELRANLAAADICVDPDPSSPLNDVSTWIKIMEYMAYAKPIVSFDLKETRFSAQEAAVYVEPNNEYKFAEAITYLMDRPEIRKQMGDFGYGRVSQQLQWSHVGTCLLTAYEKLIQKAEHNPPLVRADTPKNSPLPLTGEVTSAK